MTTIAYDPFSTETRGNPYPHYAELRKSAPVYRLDGPGFHLVSRYEDVLFVVKHPEIFSSKAMQRMMMSGMVYSRPIIKRILSPRLPQPRP